MEQQTILSPTTPPPPTPAPDVSVIIPAFNAAGTVVRALDSVRAQQGPRWEVIVIDDGSADDTVATVRANIGAGEPIRLLRMAQNSGVSAARNTGIQAAQGRYMAFLDADDVWMPDKLRQQMACLESDPDVTLVSCNSRLVTPEGVPIKEGHRNRPPVQGANAWKTLLEYNFLPTPTVMARTAMIRAIGGFDVSLKVGEDLDLWIKLGTRGKIAVLSDILINYYDTAGSLMKRHSHQTWAIVLPMIERHLAEQGARLSAAELRGIRGRQAFAMGCDMFFGGNYLASVPVFITACRHGTRPFKSLTYIPRALVKEALARLRAGGGKRP